MIDDRQMFNFPSATLGDLFSRDMVIETQMNALKPIWELNAPGMAKKHGSQCGGVIIICGEVSWWTNGPSSRQTWGIHDDHEPHRTLHLVESSRPVGVMLCRRQRS